MHRGILVVWGIHGEAVPLESTNLFSPRVLREWVVSRALLVVEKTTINSRDQDLGEWLA
jgi:hypothetical protein